MRWDSRSFLWQYERVTGTWGVADRLSWPFLIFLHSSVTACWRRCSVARTHWETTRAHQCPPVRQRCPACPRRRRSSCPGREPWNPDPHICRGNRRHDAPHDASSTVGWHFLLFNSMSLFPVNIFISTRHKKDQKNSWCECNKYCIVKNDRMLHCSWFHIFFTFPSKSSSTVHKVFWSLRFQNTENWNLINVTCGTTAM